MDTETPWTLGTGADEAVGGRGRRCCCCCLVIGCGKPGRWIGLGNETGGATGLIMLPTIIGGRTRPVDYK